MFNPVNVGNPLVLTTASRAWVSNKSPMQYYNHHLDYKALHVFNNQVMPISLKQPSCHSLKRNVRGISFHGSFMQDNVLFPILLTSHHQYYLKWTFLRSAMSLWKFHRSLCIRNECFQKVSELPFVFPSV